VSLPADHRGRLATIRILAEVGCPDRVIAQHLKVTEFWAWVLRTRAGIPPGSEARARYAPPVGLTARTVRSPRRFDLEDTDEL
jgi:hypothetical protein